MEFEVSAEAKDKRLNRAVAITVVILSVAMGLGNIKDGNIVQAMDQAQARSVDLWNEYQATRTKLRVTEIAGVQLAAMHAAPSAQLAGDAARYRAEAPRLAIEAAAASARYDALNVHDDQFDASEAALATAISICAVAALAESGWLLVAAWGLAAFGLFLSACGFAGWGFHPDVLSTLLG
jgi:hypothetical protein